MFEDSLMESQNLLSSPNQRWTAILSLTFQCSLVAAAISLPLLHPEALPTRAEAPKIMIPLKAAPPRLPHVEATTAASASLSASHTVQALSGPRRIPSLGQTTSDIPPQTSFTGVGMADPNGIVSAFADTTSNRGPNIRVASLKPAQKAVLQISTGVSAGLLLAPITPVYPRIAVAARIEGTVRVEAIISKSGRIESAHVVSGPEMLSESALNAIRNAHYTPYLLSGSPTEIETTITVNFKLAS